MFPIDVLTFDLERELPDGVEASPMIHGIDKRYLAVGFAAGVPLLIVAGEDQEQVEMQIADCVAMLFAGSMSDVLRFGFVVDSDGIVEGVYGVPNREDN